MRKSLIIPIAKVLLFVIISVYTKAAYSQNSNLNITSVMQAAYFEDNSNSVPTQAASEYDFLNDLCTSPAPDIMVLFVSPDPCVGDYKINIVTTQNTGISIRVFAASGKLVRRIAARRGEAIFFGNDLRPGNYTMEIVQGTTRKIQRLVKYK